MKQDYHPESYYRDKLCLDVGGQVEVDTVAGKIDILSSSEIIEVGSFRKWKEAIGQVIVYGAYYPDKNKRIHLYGYCSDCLEIIIKNHCDALGITLTVEKTQNIRKPGKKLTLRLEDYEYHILVDYCLITSRNQNDVLRELMRSLH